MEILAVLFFVFLGLLAAMWFFEPHLNLSDARWMECYGVLIFGMFFVGFLMSVHVLTGWTFPKVTVSW